MRGGVLKFGLLSVNPQPFEPPRERGSIEIKYSLGAALADYGAPS